MKRSIISVIAVSFVLFINSYLCGQLPGQRQEGWETIPPNPYFSAKGHSAIWTGRMLTEEGYKAYMIVWGGIDSNGEYLNKGARYDPVAREWKEIPTNGAPPARAYHTAVWTGIVEGKMIIWGGYDGSSYLNNGGIYDARTNEWVTLNYPNFSADPDIPLGRQLHTAVWHPTENTMTVWGGQGGAGDLDDGAIYDLENDDWSLLAPLGTTGDDARREHTSTITWAGGSEIYMVMFGGWSIRPPGALLNLEISPPYAWLDMNTSAGTYSNAAPGPRIGHTSLWVDTNYTDDYYLKNLLIIFGGQNPWTGEYQAGGGFYFPFGLNSPDLTKVDIPPDSWRDYPAGPLAVAWHSAIWTGSDMVIWGGIGVRGPTDRGAYLRLTPAEYTIKRIVDETVIETIVFDVKGEWSNLPVVSFLPSKRYGHSGIFASGIPDFQPRMIIWGGMDTDGRALNTGGEYFVRFAGVTEEFVWKEPTGDIATCSSSTTFLPGPWSRGRILLEAGLILGLLFVVGYGLRALRRYILISSR